ncbi:zinc-dependent metalloprotease [Inhella proteolytica]|uniref:Zinc-dependent metalloprotease n=1 Tax=Inhella proteolytica TaxID=2795029 RepID=A0A931IZ46_9BURK|nr:zinc-dependent metalloprotease [Inhella proteolytica]MBH9575411.1 zinc-dependent metalloprotease [Inhella proteolytica]
MARLRAGSSAGSPLRLSLLALAAGLALSGCATPADPAGQAKPAAAPAAAAKPAAAASASAGAAPAAPAAPAARPPGQPQPFAAVIKDAQRFEGLFTVYQKDDKVWIELAPEDLNKSFLFSPKFSRGIGEKMLYGGLMTGTWGPQLGNAQLAQFRRVHNQVQLVALNTEFTAKTGTPNARGIERSYSPSLLGSVAVASQPHPERKSILIEANNLFLADTLGLGVALNRAFRQNYALDRGNTSFVSVRASSEGVFIDTQQHFATATLAAAQPPTPGAPPSPLPQPSTPRAVPDARSLFMGVHYTLMKLPEAPMQARSTDARLGHFRTLRFDFSDDLARTPAQRLLQRWRLEKKDPAAAVSEPVKPITFWIDRNVPHEYREAMTAGVLEWNKAFERAGFKNAVVVKVQGEQDSFDTLDGNVASLRWMNNIEPSFGAIGPSHVDPRSGEILDADIGFEGLSSRNLRALRAQVLPNTSPAEWGELLQARDAQREGLLGTPPAAHTHTEACQYGAHATEQLGLALDVLASRGELDPDGPEARAFVMEYVKDVTMHEVGHTLGLRHNFRSSQVYTDAQLSKLDFTTATGLAGSVMEYAPINLPAPGQPRGTYFQSTLGPYDYWVIEYAYKPLPREHEAAELQKIAARSAEPQLAYGTDEDNFLGIDPDSLHFDLGKDPVAFARKRIEIARDLIAKQETRSLKPSEDYAVLRRAVSYGVRDVARAAGVLARQIGGLRTLRDFPGSGRDPMQPVEAKRQREALDLIGKGLLAADAFTLSPALQRRLAPDYLERGDALSSGMPVSTDFSLSGMVLDLQRALLAQLMSDGVAARILDSEGKFEKRAEAFRLSELYQRLSQDVWSELGAGSDIPLARRELQREHANRLASTLLRPAAGSRADARSLVRAEARALLTRVKASPRAALSAEARAHLDDVAETLELALQAKLQRTGL